MFFIYKVCISNYHNLINDPLLYILPNLHHPKLEHLNQSQSQLVCIAQFVDEHVLSVIVLCKNSSDSICALVDYSELWTLRQHR
jgi:hypothetical protein